MGLKKPNVSETEYEKIWDYKKNDADGLKPDSISLGSARKPWWICKKGHSYQQAVNKKVRSGVDSCTVCSGQLIVPGVNDLATLNPKIASDWDVLKNEKKSNEVSPGSEIKYWWLCDKGHSYLQPPYARIKDGQGCPYCRNKKVLKGYNDMATTHPELARIWDFEKNKDSGKTPYNITAGHDSKVWWLCDEGHSVDQTPYEKSYVLKGCPVCTGKRVIEEVNDLASLRPEILKYWDFKKNTDITPFELTVSSSKKVWWICEEKHSFERTPNEMFNSQKGKVVKCGICSNRKMLKGFNDLATTKPELLSRWDYKKNIITPEEVTAGSHTKVWWICEKGHSINSPVKDTEIECYKCSPWGTSKAEEELISYIKSILPENYHVEENYRGLISPYEVDVYIPELSIAIEFNGLYWHSEKVGKDRNYHKNKWVSCNEKGVQLISIWEDNWRDRRYIVEKMLAHKLSVSKEKKIFARKTIVEGISSVEAKSFCKENHIQGFTSGSFYLGLSDKETGFLVAVSVWRKLEDKLYLDRYCTSILVPGGLGKMLKLAKKQAVSLGCSSIVTFANREVSNGNLYEKLGFRVDKILNPDYSYFYNQNRVHKFSFRISRFKNDPELEYKENFTETRLAELNNIPRIWDCGKIRYVIDLEKQVAPSSPTALSSHTKPAAGKPSFNRKTENRAMNKPSQQPLF